MEKSHVEEVDLIQDLNITRAGEFMVKANWSLTSRLLDEHELVYFPVGTQTVYKVNGEVFNLDVPCFIVIRPGEVHSFIFDPIHPTRHLFIHFTVEYSSELSAIYSILTRAGPTMVYLDEPLIIPVFLRKILQIANKKASRWRQRCRSILYATLGEIEAMATDEITTKEKFPFQIEKSLEYIGKNLMNPSLFVAEVAEYTGWSHEHFTRQFVFYVGWNPREFILRKRVDHASQLLLHEQWSIKEIAYAVGFVDEHYFSRAFKKMKGITATKYREKYADPIYRSIVSIEENQTLYPINKFFDDF